MRFLTLNLYERTILVYMTNSFLSFCRRFLSGFFFRLSDDKRKTDNDDDNDTRLHIQVKALVRQTKQKCGGRKKFNAITTESCGEEKKQTSI